MEKENQTAQVIGAVLLGAAIGGVLGVLFAPDKGAETRKKLFGSIKGFSKGEEKEEETKHEAESGSVVAQNAM